MTVQMILRPDYIGDALALFGSSVISFLPLNDSSGTFLDASGNGYTGTGGADTTRGAAGIQPEHTHNTPRTSARDTGGG